MLEFIGNKNSFIKSFIIKLSINLENSFAIALIRFALVMTSLLVGSPKIDKKDGIDEIKIPINKSNEITKKFFLLWLFK